MMAVGGWLCWVGRMVTVVGGWWCWMGKTIEDADYARQTVKRESPSAMDEDSEHVDYTIPNFTWIIAVMDLARNWAVRWLRIGMPNS
ncbi:hypothetical protein M8C21_032731 [Ambrosia artemisiifolia]|uniref:Uncharacterized protein n=1 Tax=Ambrosia artemisiifolia TaxID=4212 RepID=A0AAD5CNE9_AMBAR|nr:hypothetical protein M8C21_032731 [Ambrosia artemisiifolia]